MSMTLDELDLIAFDPPHLGMPAGPCRCGRWEEEGEGFVEIFVRVEDERIVDVGFLTSAGMEGLLCASTCCAMLLDKSLDDALALDEHDLVRRFPSAMRTATLQATAACCLAACRQALPRLGDPTSPCADSSRTGATEDGQKRSVPGPR